MAGRVLAVVGAFALVAAGFLPWDRRGVIALDIGAFTWETARQPTVGLVLVGLAALAALAALLVDWAWPRVVAAVGGAGLVLSWLATGPEATLTSGVWTALGGTIALLIAAGIAPRQADTSRRPANARPSVTSSA